MPIRFTGKTVLITGAVGALGEGLARAFAGEGATVAVAARQHHEERGVRLAKEIGNDSLFVPLDVADEENWKAAVAAVEERVGPLSTLVSNAAYVVPGGIEGLPVDEWRRILDTNLTGSFLGMRAAAPSIRRSGGGSILQISSVAAFIGSPALAGYSASKWGLRGLVRTAAVEFARDNIRVNAFHPGIIETPLAYDPDTGEQYAPTGELAIPRNVTVEETTKYALFLASEDAAYATGSELVADGGFALGPIAG